MKHFFLAAAIAVAAGAGLAAPVLAQSAPDSRRRSCP
jgi:hypothetical protein